MTNVFKLAEITELKGYLNLIKLLYLLIGQP